MGCNSSRGCSEVTRGMCGGGKSGVDKGAPPPRQTPTATPRHSFSGWESLGGNATQSTSTPRDAQKIEMQGSKSGKEEVIAQGWFRGSVIRSPPRHLPD